MSILVLAQVQQSGCVVFIASSRTCITAASCLCFWS